MIGAIIGDIVGSRFEWDNHRSKNFDFLTHKCFFTDDSVMSLAVCDALLHAKSDYSDLNKMAVESMQRIGRPYPHCGYGGSFRHWMYSDNPQPYNSYGNGAAMRVSGCGYAANSIEEAIQLSKAVTTIDQLFSVGSSKRVFQKDWKSEGVPFYRAREIVKLSEQGYVDNELFITEEMYADYAEKYGVPQPDDIMVTGVGTLGICYLVKPGDRFYYKDGNTLCFHSLGRINSRFVLECYKMPFSPDGPGYRQARRSHKRHPFRATRSHSIFLAPPGRNPR